MKSVSYLTEKEYELMKILWASEGPLSVSDILDKKTNDSFSQASLHPLINSLLDKGFIEIVGKVQKTKTRSRLFSVKLTYEEYVAMQLQEINKNSNVSLAPAIKRLVSYFAKSSDKDDNLLKELDAWLEQRINNK